MARLEVGQQAPEATVLDSEGKAVSLSTIWQDQPVLLTFLRHFG